ncbi:hypothetical protein D3C77_375540 [compost metagenome]
MWENSQHWYGLSRLRRRRRLSEPGALESVHHPVKGDHASCRTRIAFGDNHHKCDVASKVMATWGAGKPAIALTQYQASWVWSMAGQM